MLFKISILLVYVKLGC